MAHKLGVSQQKTHNWCCKPGGIRKGLHGFLLGSLEGAAQCDYLQCSNQRVWLGGNPEGFNGAKLTLSWKRLVSFQESVAKGYIFRYSVEQNALHVFGFQNGETDKICLRYQLLQSSWKGHLEYCMLLIYLLFRLLLLQWLHTFEPTFCGVVGEGWGQWQAAVQILQELKGRSEMSPDVLSYNSLISVCHVAAELHSGRCFVWFVCYFLLRLRGSLFCFFPDWAIFL